MLNTLLRDVDFMSMFHAPEVQVPLVGRLLAQTVLAFSRAWKMNGRTPTNLLVPSSTRSWSLFVLHR
jgi:hypothetical protein